jgi:hypothetical protein
MARKHRFAIAAVALVLAFLFLHVIRLAEPFGVDQGLFACFTRWVPRGWLPYRDLFDSKPPLFLYWWGLARIVPGDLPRAIWWFQAIWLSATLVVAYAFVRRLWGRGAGLAASTLLVLGLWSPTFGGYWSRAQAEEVLVLPMLLSAWSFLRAREHARFALFAGVLAGICGLFKIPSMAIAGAWAIAWLVEGPVRVAAKRIGLAIAGVAVPWAVAFAWFATHRATASFIDGVFVYHRYNAQFIAPPWSFVGTTFAQTIVDGALLPLVAAAIAMFILARRRARESVWLGAWIVLTMAAVVLQRQLAGYHYLLAMPALAVAGGYAVSVALRGVRSSGRTRMVCGGALVALLSIAVLDFSRWSDAYGPGFDHVRGKIDRAQYLRTLQQGNYSSAHEEQAAAWVRDHTSPEQGVFVWGLAPGLPALADRHPTTRYPFHKILLTDAPLSRLIPGLETRRAELLARLQRDPPAYVLVGRNDRNGFEPLDSQTSLKRFVALNELIERDYAIETTIGSFVILRRKSP